MFSEVCVCETFVTYSDFYFKTRLISFHLVMHSDGKYIFLCLFSVSGDVWSLCVVDQFFMISLRLLGAVIEAEPCLVSYLSSSSFT